MDKKSLDGLALLHDLVPFLPVDRLHAILAGQNPPTDAQGTALFADISGFTALAERLARELGPERGAEELNTQVNYTFVGLIDATDRYRGSVLRFSGDGLTVWFAGPNHTLHAVTAALAMQAVMQAVTPVLPSVRLKVGIGTGAARRFCPGNPALGIYDVLAGPAIEQMAAAEGVAEPGQVVLSAEAAAALGDQLALKPLADGYQALVPTIFAPSPPDSGRWPSIHWLNHLDRAWALVEACRPFLPAPIYERLESGRGGYMADLRLASPLFVQLAGIDYSAPEAAPRLDALVRKAQEIVARHGGWLNEVGVGDKGSVLVALFGAPIALENPASSAAGAALALQDALPYVQSVRVGLTCGRLFTATVGSPMRRAYAAIGDDVNLAARLMTHAQPGETLASYSARDMARDKTWTSLPPIRVKGKVAPVRIYHLQGQAAAPITAGEQEASLIPRTREMESLHWLLDAFEIRRTRILIMQGEPGLGKSHLLGEFAALLQARGIGSLQGNGHNIEQQSPYRVWREIFTTYFELDRVPGLAQQRAQVEARLALIAPNFLDLAPLLNDVLQLGILETDLTAGLDPAQRHAALTQLLVALLRAWLNEDGLALVVDNAQWLDALSWDLLNQVAHEIDNRPLAILLALRPLDRERPHALRAIQERANSRQLPLHKLDAEDCALLAAEQLGVERLPAPISQIIMQKSAGNPLFVKEITTTLVESGIIEVQDGQVRLCGDPATLQLPDNVEGVVRNRIDHLPPDQQTLLKVAAVLGPQFEFRTLRDVQPLSLDEAALRANLEALETLDVILLGPEDGEDSLYAFRYTITRDVAYHTLSFSQRRQIHRAVALWYEHEHAANLAPYYALLAHHWRAAEDRPRELDYTYKAGLQAAAQYANEDAIRYLTRALDLSSGEDDQLTYGILWKLETLFHLRGMRDFQRIMLEGMEALAVKQDDDEWRANAGISHARYYESVAAYADCVTAADKALQAAQRAQDARLMGLASIYRGLGLAHQGAFEEASASLLEIYAPGDPNLEAWRLDVLGTTLSQMGLMQEATHIYAQALNQANVAGDRSVVARVLNHQGDNAAMMGSYEQAKTHYSQALNIRQTIGDRQGAAETLNSLGNVALETGDYEEALHYLEQTTEDFKATGDREGEAAALNNLGRLSFERGDYPTARRQLQEALTLRRAIGNPQSTSVTLMNLGLVEARLDNLIAAEQYFGESMATDQNLGQTALAASQYAGWGLIGYKQGNRAEALAHIQSALDAIARYGLAQISYPFMLSLICYEVLDAYAEHAQAAAVLEQAYRLLIQRADQIVDPERRARYLLTIPTHRQIVGLYETLTNSAPTA